MALPLASQGFLNLACDRMLDLVQMQGKQLSLTAKFSGNPPNFHIYLVLIDIILIIIGYTRLVLNNKG